MFRVTPRIAWLTVCLAAGLACLTGCRTRRMTHTPRAAIEQLLVSGAIDRALQRFELPEVKGKRVHLDFTNLKCIDAEYVKLVTRVRFAELGATLVDKPDAADYVAEVASGAVGTEAKEMFVGMPPMPVPNSPVPTPEAPIYRSGEQTGIVKLLIFVHERGRMLVAYHVYGKCDRDESFLFGWKSYSRDQVREGWERSDRQLLDRKAATRPK